MARTGNVKWFSNEKGYGFIEQEDGEDVFVHHSDIEGEGYKTLKQGETVEYEIIQADKGPKAQNVIRSEAAEGNGTGASSGGGESRDESSGRNGGGSGRSATTSDSGREEPRADSSLARQLRKKLSERFLGGD